MRSRKTLPPWTRIICLANSRKHGAYCVAGMEPETGQWIRPVSHLEDGRVERSMSMVDGRAASLCELLDIPLDSKGPDFGFESENLSIRPGPWRVAGSVAPYDLIPRCSREPLILHNTENYVTVQYLQSLSFKERRTLQLVEAFEFEPFNGGPSAQGGSRWYGSFISNRGERLRARVTDPVLVEKLERGYRPGAHCLITVSLSMPYRPAGWGEEGDPCWKLIAGVIELDHGSWGDDRALLPSPCLQEDRASPRASPVTDEQVRTALKKIFGFDSFRPHQEECVRAILKGRDCFVVMPTGGGKSLCFQLPAHLLPGTCLVVSPLISLMKDQVDAARENGLRAAFINSTQTDQERIRVFRDLQESRLDLLYVSPERFAMETFLNHLKRADLCLAAIDEAHCVSEWGHDFRPDYLFLSEIVNHFPSLPVAAFTATATPRVQKDIIERLRLRSPHLVRASFDRPNLFYEVVPKADAEHQILAFVRERPGDPGIVYRTTRESVDETADRLKSHGIKAVPYHAGLGDETRRANQEAFNRDDVEVVVATIAFGMGIDKSNVRYVLHADLPKNMESYYQETGRAGRDGDPARCLLLFGRGDIPKIRHFMDQMEDETERRRSLARLNEMIHYAGGGQACRRRRILAYFGEEYGRDHCGSCDVCSGQMEEADITRDAQVILSAIARTRERFGAVHIVDIVRGANTKKIRAFGHQALQTYGAGKDKDTKHWRQIIDDLLSLRVIIQSEGEFPALQLAPEAYAVLKGRRAVTAMRRRQRPAEPPEKGGPARYRHDLFERLRALRRRLASERGVPPFVIFSDRSLHEMAETAPRTRMAFLRVHGIGETKWGLYGETFLKEIEAHLSENPEAEEMGEPTAEPPKTRPSRSRKVPTIEETWDLVRQGLAIEQIASERGLTEGTVAGHVERLILEGREIDIERLIPNEVRNHLEDLIRMSGSGGLREIIEKASIPVSYEQARMVRAWVRSKAPLKRPTP
jgi:ATP-dependent DNA helicase RecQ